MTLTLDDLDFLTSGAGEKLLERLRREDLSESNHLTLFTVLRKEYALEQVRAAVNLALVRIKAVDKFGADAAKMFFTDEALQQASDCIVRNYRSTNLKRPMSTIPLYYRRFLDVCCGIGADLFSMALANAYVTGLDIDRVRIKMAQLNADVLNLKTAHFQVADVREGIPHGYDTIFYDPARRDDKGNRIHDVERYIPPLSLVKNWQAMLIAVKLSPGVALDQLNEYQGGIEFISVDGDLKEATMWLGAEWRGLKATLLSGSISHHYQRQTEPGEKSLSEPLGWLIEPDPSIIRAGLVQDLAIELGGYLLDETIAYFTTDKKPASVWVRAWQILDWMPFNLKKLRAYLRERNVGTVTVKKRGSALTPEGLIADLKLKGDETRTLVLTRCAGRPIVMICSDYLA